MSKFSFIDDLILRESVAKLIEAATQASLKAEEDLEKNTLDPFSALFEAMAQKLSLDEWKSQEKNRQIQKSIQNAIGEFHQHILGSFRNWSNPGKGGSFDVENEQSKIIAEVKNKHNTMNSSSALATYRKLSEHLKYDKKGYTAFLVQIVPYKPADYNEPWSPNLATEMLREDIRRIDGESFYDLASGEKDTLLRIYTVLPDVISEILGDNAPSNEYVEEFLNLFRLVYK